MTSLVTGPGVVSFALDTTSTTSKSLPSREATANQPQLEVDTGGGHHHHDDHPAADHDYDAPQGRRWARSPTVMCRLICRGRSSGTATAVKVDGSPVTVSYLKFDVQGVTGAPARAT